MASVMAIVSKAVFEKQARGIGVGDVWPTDRYTTKNKTVASVADGGSIFLVTVRPPEQLWLIGVLDEPEHDGTGWVAQPNTTPVRELGSVLDRLVLEHGNGIAFEPGKLAMSLQSPRVLADADVALLRAAPKNRSVAKKKSVADAPGRAVALDDVHAAIAAGKHDAALRTLIARWKTTRAPALAEAIDVLSKRVAGAVIEGETPEAQTAAWNRAAKAGELVDLGALLEHIRDGTTADGVTRRIASLMRRYREDPRLATFVHSQLDQVAYTANSSMGVWDAFFEVLRRTPDPRTVVAIAATRDRWDKKLAKRGKYHREFLADMDAVAVIASAVTTADVSRDAVASILALGHVESADDRTHAGLFEQVYRDPSNDAARSVLADALLEAEDPRGELIQLQLAKATRKLSADERRREKQLVTKHGRAWLGELGPFVSTKDLEYERGFASRVTLVKPSGKHPAYPLAAPERATIETLEIATSLMPWTYELGRRLRDGVKEWIRTFPSVRRLEINSFAALGQLVADGPVPYAELVLSDVEKAPWLTRKNFPNLRRIEHPYSGKVTNVTNRWFASQKPKQKAKG